MHPRHDQWHCNDYARGLDLHVDLSARLSAKQQLIEARHAVGIGQRYTLYRQHEAGLQAARICCTHIQCELPQAWQKVRRGVGDWG